MSGQRGFIYLNKRPRLPRDVSCRVLTFCAWGFTAFVLGLIVGIGSGLLWWLK